MHKVNLLIYGEKPVELDQLSDYYESFYPIANFDNIPKGDFCVLDWRAWLYSEKTFTKYVKTIANIDCKYIIVFENPFQFFMPEASTIRDFFIKLDTFTKIAYDIIKSNNPTQTVLSPAITVINEALSQKYLGYFVNNKNYFDVYNVHMCDAFNELTIAKLSGFINQILQVSIKPTFVTRWVAPCCDNSAKPAWSQKIMANKLIDNFLTIEKATRNNCFWFYNIFAHDLYDLTLDPQKCVLLNEDRLMYPISKQWEPHHFFGIRDNLGNIKEKIASTIMELSSTSTNPMKKQLVAGV